MGQNFLINEHAAEKITESLKLSASDVVVEIGAGKGALTKYLLGQSCKVIAVEIDQRWCRYLQERFSGHENLRIVNQDVLKLDLKEFAGGKKIKVVGNIPYHLTAPIVSFLIDKRKLISLAVLTLQREVAKRICAKPGSGDWSLLSILTQLYARARVLLILKPGCFFPSPKVCSATVELTFLDDLAVKVGDEKKFFRLAGTIFQQKRKMIVNSLASGLDLPKAEIKERLAQAGIDCDLRPQALGLEKLAIISFIL